MRFVSRVIALVVVVGLGLPWGSTAAGAAPTPQVVVQGRKPAPKPASDACGARLVKADGSYYSCSVAENFSGDTLNRDLWHTMEVSPAGQNYCAVNSPETVAVSGGTLKLTVRPADARTPCPARADGTVAPYATGWINTFWKWSQQYGRFEARMRSTATTAPGLQEAFWLWPDVRYTTDTSWPASGEIDIVETYSVYPKLAIPFLHYGADDNGGPVPGLNTAWDCAAERGLWHTYALEWTATRLSIFVDGRLCLTNTAGATAMQKRFIMSLAQLTTNTGANTFDGSAPVPATTEVDWVKVWR